MSSSASARYREPFPKGTARALRVCAAAHHPHRLFAGPPNGEGLSHRVSRDVCMLLIQ